MTRILVAEALNAPLSPLAGLDVVVRDQIWSDRTALRTAIADCDGLIVRNQTQVDADLLEAAPRLRAVGRLGAGLDNINLDALRARSVILIHGGGLNAQAVAEYVIGALLVLARGLAAADHDVRAGGWSRRPGWELHDQALGVIGLGATGLMTAQLARSMGLRVRGHDPFPEREPTIENVSLDVLLRSSRMVSVHVPLSSQTRALIGARELALMPPGGLLVNAARGGVVEEAALLMALDSGHLAGAALDVREVEPPTGADPFRARADVLLTPHIAGLTVESQAAIAEHVLTGVRAALRS